MQMRSRAPAWGLMSALLVCVLAAPVAAQPKGKDKGPVAAPAPAPAAAAAPAEPAKTKKTGKAKDFDFTGINFTSSLRTPQLLYFLERANEELERASLEKRSFIPHMVRSVEEEAL